MARVDGMDKQAARLIDEAEAESKTALDTLKQLADLEKKLPDAPKVLNNLNGTLSWPSWLKQECKS